MEINISLNIILKLLAAQHYVLRPGLDWPGSGLTNFLQHNSKLTAIMNKKSKNLATVMPEQPQYSSTQGRKNYIKRSFIASSVVHEEISKNPPTLEIMYGSVQQQNSEPLAIINKKSKKT